MSCCSYKAGLTRIHDCPCAQGIVTMMRSGSSTMTGKFSILLSPAPHLDGVYSVVGEVVDGWDVLTRITAQAASQVTKSSVGTEAQVR